MLKLNELKQKRAITLVALIITIIVMLILVGVSVSVLINSDLIGTAQNAGERTETAYGEEGQMGQITVGNTTYWSIEDYLNDRPKEDIQITLSVESNPVIPTVTNGNTIYTDKNGKTAVIPAGFTVSGVTSEQTIDGGLVIYEIPENGTVDWTNTNINMQESYNQFVWVPVEENHTIKIKVRSEEEITAIRVGSPTVEITTDKNGNEFIPIGTKYEVEINPTINGTYTVQVTAGEEKKTGIFNVSSLYAQDFFFYKQISDVVTQLEAAAAANNMTADEFLASGALASQYPGFTSLVEGPMYVYNAYKASKYTDTTGNSSMASFATSVQKYGGFYIARYEAGSATARIGEEVETLALTTVLSKKNQYPYNNISQTEAIDKSESMYSATTTPAITSVISTLPNAAAFDRTLNWLIETKAVTQEEVTEDSTSWGNYENNEFKFTGKYSINDGASYTEVTTLTDKIKYETSNKEYLLGTGITEYTKRNNIYDLAGNCAEWSTELYSTSSVALRGSDYRHEGINSAVGFTRGDENSDFSTFWLAFRPVLYVK